MRILLIDDDARLRQVMGRLLREAGFEAVDEACDGEDALLAMGRARPDLVITDCQMPRLDGLGFVRRLRGGGDATPVIMISGQGDPHMAVTAVRAGVNNFLPKPINPEFLLEKIHQTMLSLRPEAAGI